MFCFIRKSTAKCPPRIKSSKQPIGMRSKYSKPSFKGFFFFFFMEFFFWLFIFWLHELKLKWFLRVFIIYEGSGKIRINWFYGYLQFYIHYFFVDFLCFYYIFFFTFFLRIFYVFVENWSFDCTVFIRVLLLIGGRDCFWKFDRATSWACDYFLGNRGASFLVRVISGAGAFCSGVNDVVFLVYGGFVRFLQVS